MTSICSRAISLLQDLDRPLGGSCSYPDLRYGCFSLNFLPCDMGVVAGRDFEAQHQQTLLPLDQRIVVQDPEKPWIFLIDNCLKVYSLPPAVIEKTLNYWKGRVKFTIITSTISSILVAAALFTAKSTVTTLFMHSPVLGVACAVAFATAIIVGIGVTVVHSVNIKTAQESLAQWITVEKHQRYHLPLPERIARMRTEIFAAYREGREIAGEAQGEIFRRCLSSSEIRPILHKGIDAAFPHLDEQEKVQRVQQKHQEYRVRRDVYYRRDISGHTWNYPFPPAYEVRAINAPAPAIEGRAE